MEPNFEKIAARDEEIAKANDVDELKDVVETSFPELSPEALKSLKEIIDKYYKKLGGYPDEYFTIRGGVNMEYEMTHDAMSNILVYDDVFVTQILNKLRTLEEERRSRL